MLPEAKLEKVENMEPNNFFFLKKEEIREGLLWQFVWETDLHLSYHVPRNQGRVLVTDSSAFDNWS